jgi:hypothetical protein
MGHSLWGITIMPLIKVYNNDSNIYGLKGHSTFKSVCNSEASWRGTFGRYMRIASAEAVSSCRTFGDEAWSQQQEAARPIDRRQRACRKRVGDFHLRSSSDGCSGTFGRVHGSKLRWDWCPRDLGVVWIAHWREPPLLMFAFISARRCCTHIWWLGTYAPNAHRAGESSPQKSLRRHRWSCEWERLQWVVDLLVDGSD